MNKISIYLTFTLLIFFAFACSDTYEAGDKDIVSTPEVLSDRVNLDIGKVLRYAANNDSRLNDTIRLNRFEITKQYYEQHDNQPSWSLNGKWLIESDSLFSFLQRCRLYGLFENDYHLNELRSLREQLKDSIQARNAILWTTADLLYTDAFFSIARDVKQGRIPYDTVTSRKDTLVPNELYKGLLLQFKKERNIDTVLASVEPRHNGYHELKRSIPGFLDTAALYHTTYIQYPFTDSMEFVKTLQRRLYELDYITLPDKDLDTTLLKKAITSYQKEHNLKSTGRINESLINSLNMSDLERFKIIALTMDKYKLLPDTLPSTYLWVNIPAYMMQVKEVDSVVLESKVIVGTSKTKTPEIVSSISNFITYPQWTVPYSIIFKEMLPQIRKDVNYLHKQNLMVVDRNENIVDPMTINWAVLSKKNFPYQLKQRQGDDNSLGIMKFNFKNKHSVYLHDTNARWMFQKTNRSLSHGCVRVQKWKELAEFLVRNDTITKRMDSVNSWIERKEKRMVYGFDRLPIYIRYFTCEAKEGRIRFYEDIYGEDRLLRETYFRNKL